MSHGSMDWGLFSLLLPTSNFGMFRTHISIPIGMGGWG